MIVVICGNIAELIRGNMRFFQEPTLRYMAKAAFNQSRWPLSGLIGIFEKRKKYDIDWYIKADTELEIFGVDGCSGDVYLVKWADSCITKPSGGSGRFHAQRLANI